MRESVQHIHLVGIGGTGMSGIAELLIGVGYNITGSDIQNSAMTHRLRKQGAKIFIGHSSEALLGADVVVVSSAIASDNVELITAKEARIPVITRAQMLAELMRFKYGIAVAGTHGKTTTTSMIATVLASAKLDPTYVIGGRFNAISANAKLGEGQYLVAEADESDGSFLQLQPVISVVTNIDEDHMQTYDHKIQVLYNAFSDFLHHLPFWGLAVLCIDDEGVRQIMPNIARKVVTYGLSEEADFRATNLKQEGIKMHFNLEVRGVPNGRIILNFPGVHSVCNALAAIAVADKLDISLKDVKEALESFSGVGRRFEIHEVSFQSKPLTWVDDYAHHPKELAVTWDAVIRCWPDKRRILIFQPHRYSRIIELFDRFVRELSLVTPDVLILMDVCSAGEDPSQGGSAETIANALRLRGVKHLIQVADNIELEDVLSNIVEEEDILISMGAGSISGWMRQLMQDMPSEQASNELN